MLRRTMRVGRRLLRLSDVGSARQRAVTASAEARRTYQAPSRAPLETAMPTRDRMSSKPIAERVLIAPARTIGFGSDKSF